MIFKGEPAYYPLGEYKVIFDRIQSIIEMNEN